MKRDQVLPEHGMLHENKIITRPLQSQLDIFNYTSVTSQTFYKWGTASNTRETSSPSPMGPHTPTITPVMSVDAFTPDADVARDRESTCVRFRE